MMPEQIDTGPDGPVQAVLDWIEGRRRLDGLEGWPEFIRSGRFGYLNDRRPVDDEEELVVLVPLDERMTLATADTDWRPVGTSVNFRVRRAEDGWQILGEAPLAL